MNYRDKDICDRLYVATPYGLADYYLLIDARKEILRLREALDNQRNTQNDNSTQID